MTCPTRAVTLQNSPGLRRYRVTYRVDLPVSNSGPNAAIAALGLQMFTSTYSYGIDIPDPLAVLIDIAVPRRAGGDKLLDKWLVDCIFEWDQSQRPEPGVATVEPFYLTESEPIVRAEYLGAFEDNQGVLSPLPTGSQSFDVGKPYPISNSARVPIIPSPERDAAKPAYRVRWTRERADFDFTQFINRMNQTQVTLTAANIRHGVVGQVQPYITFQKQFAAETIRLRDVQVSPVIYYGKQWFEHTLEFIEDKAFIDELDRGVTARAEPGEPDGRGGTYSGGDFPDGASGTREITDPDGNPVSDPVLLDGRGQPRVGSEAKKPVYLRWRKYELADFNQLPIGVL